MEAEKSYEVISKTIAWSLRQQSVNFISLEGMELISCFLSHPLNKRPKRVHSLALTPPKPSRKNKTLKLIPSGHRER